MGLFIWASVLFAGNYMFAAVALDSFTPIEISWIRTTIAAIFLLTYMVIKRDKLPRGLAIWVKLNISAFLLNTVAFLGMASAVTRISTVQTSILNALVPLATLLFVILFVPEEKPTLYRVTGLMMGFAGAVALAEPWKGLGATDIFGTTAILASTFSYAGGLVYVKRTFVALPYSSLSLTAGQMISSAVHFTILLPWFHSEVFNPMPKTVASVIALGIFGTALTFLLIQKLIKVAGASIAGDTTYLIVFVAMALGVLVLGEPITTLQIIGAGSILAGLVVINRENRTPAHNN
jgi:drug/metabolite transporter (DMT)-like permease